MLYCLNSDFSISCCVLLSFSLYKSFPKYYCAPAYENNFGGILVKIILVRTFFGNNFFNPNYGAHP